MFSSKTIAACAMGMFLIATAPASILAADDGVRDANQRLRASLNQRLKQPIEVEDMPLRGLLALIAEDHELPFLIDETALDEVAISADTEVSISVKYISIRSALNHLFRQPGVEDLTYVVQDEVLLITTNDRANAVMVPVVYRVDDLLLGAKGQEDVESRLYDIAKVITHCIQPMSWNESGGGADLVQLAPGILVVNQTEQVHGEISALLADVRKAVVAIEQAADGSSADLAAAEAPGDDGG